MCKEAPYTKCSRFKECSINSCPLHPAYPDIYTDPEDQDKKCTMAKSIRVRIGSQYPDVLSYQGMTKREYAGQNAWNNLDESKRAAITREGKKRLKALHSQNQKSTPMALSGGIV